MKATNKNLNGKYSLNAKTLRETSCDTITTHQPATKVSFMESATPKKKKKTAEFRCLNAIGKYFVTAVIMRITTSILMPMFKQENIKCIQSSL